MNATELPRWNNHPVLLETKSGHVFARAVLRQTLLSNGVSVGLWWTVFAPQEDFLFRMEGKETAFLGLTEELIERMEVINEKLHLRLDGKITVGLHEVVKFLTLASEGPPPAMQAEATPRKTVFKESTTNEPPPKTGRYGDDIKFG